MIYASLNAKKGNYQYPAAINTALEFLAKPETAELPVGRYELDGDNILFLFRIRQQLQLRISVQKVTEIILISSIFSQEKEVQGYAPLLQELQVKSQLVKTISFYETVENEQFVTLHPGEFTVYFTNDIHRPNCTMDEPVNIHKAVVKIKESLIK
mgnify:CR=1 FL=1